MRDALKFSLRRKKPTSASPVLTHADRPIPAISISLESDDDHPQASKRPVRTKQRKNLLVRSDDHRHAALTGGETDLDDESLEFTGAARKRNNYGREAGHSSSNERHEIFAHPASVDDDGVLIRKQSKIAHYGRKLRSKLDTVKRQFSDQLPLSSPSLRLLTASHGSTLDEMGRPTCPRLIACRLCLPRTGLEPCVAIRQISPGHDQILPGENASMANAPEESISRPVPSTVHQQSTRVHLEQHHSKNVRAQRRAGRVVLRCRRRRLAHEPQPHPLAQPTIVNRSSMARDHVRGDLPASLRRLSATQTPRRQAVGEPSEILESEHLLHAASIDDQSRSASAHSSSTTLPLVAIAGDHAGLVDSSRAKCCLFRRSRRHVVQDQRTCSRFQQAIFRSIETFPRRSQSIRRQPSRRSTQTVSVSFGLHATSP